jgi:hypothetical protein
MQSNTGPLTRLLPKTDDLSSKTESKPHGGVGFAGPPERDESVSNIEPLRLALDPEECKSRPGASQGAATGGAETLTLYPGRALEALGRSREAEESRR